MILDDYTGLLKQNDVGCCRMNDAGEAGRRPPTDNPAGQTSRLSDERYNQEIKNGQREVFNSSLLTLILIVLVSFLIVFVPGLVDSLTTGPWEATVSGFEFLVVLMAEESGLYILPILTAITIAITVSSQSSIRYSVDQSQDALGRSEINGKDVSRAAEARTINIVAVLFSLLVSSVSCLYSVILFVSGDLLTGVLSSLLFLFLTFECVRLSSSMKRGPHLIRKKLDSDNAKFSHVFRSRLENRRRPLAWMLSFVSMFLIVVLIVGLARSLLATMSVGVGILVISALVLSVSAVMAQGLVDASLSSRLLPRLGSIALSLAHWMLSIQFILIFFGEVTLSDLSALIGCVVAITILSVLVSLWGIGWSGMGIFRAFGARFVNSRAVSDASNCRLIYRNSQICQSVLFHIFGMVSMALFSYLPYLAGKQSSWGAISFTVTILLAVYAVIVFARGAGFCLRLASTLFCIVAVGTLEIFISIDVSGAHGGGSGTWQSAIGFLISLIFCSLIIWDDDGLRERIPWLGAWIDRSMFANARRVVSANLGR